MSRLMGTAESENIIAARWQPGFVLPPRSRRRRRLAFGIHSHETRSWTRHRPLLCSSLERQAEHVLVVTGNRLQCGFFIRVERLARIPSVLAGRDDPVVSIGVPDDPMFGARPIYENGGSTVDFGFANHSSFLLSDSFGTLLSL